MPLFKRTLLIALLAASLGGCESYADSYGDLTSDAFEPGNASQSRFTLDSADCSAAAEYPRSYDVAGIWSDSGERHEIFNRAYTACMAKLGYQRRDVSGKYPAPYTFDFTP